ncbi:ATP-dependent helicase [Bacillus suaedaesalsae]|uniref:DNA 3'-5' helicase n=1 Tax=Bacillus suaedaesalsae TaxID=2810349 RepID=A0ABS2DFV1_9BACI|nr:ATP-dependent helicase [Bacillus suaedaesalsae]MBM6617296.1 ATP-dependent helicase [Bacillus suaedaesalsae]
MDLFSEKLNQIKTDDKQFEAYNTEISTVVIAGPGSGKTTVLTLKIINLLRNKINQPRGLACITYSKEAVKEFTERLNELGYKNRKNVFLGTVHSFCIAEVIAPFAKLYDLDISFPLKIISEKEREELFEDIVTELKLGGANLSIDDVDKERSLNISGLSLVQVESYDIALKVALEYEKRLVEMDKVDFVGIVKCATMLIQTKPYVRKCLAAKFPWILIDEYQDLGKPLHEMILSLFNMTNIKIFAVGDPDQSIYSFNGAIPQYLIELKENPIIKEIKLKTNYRSNQDIINASILALGQQNRSYSAGTRKNENAKFHFVTCEQDIEQQYDYVISNIIPSCLAEGIPHSEICVLVSGNKQAKELAALMDVQSIPYYISKLDYKRTDLIIWLEDCAKWINKQYSQSFTNIFEFWIDLIKKHNVEKKLSINILNERRALYGVLNSSKEYADNLFEWVKYLFRQLNIIPILETSLVYPDEIDNINNFIKTVVKGSLAGATVQRFGSIGKPNNQVTISTRHSSKGLEFEVVILLGMEEGNFPYYLNVNNKEKLAEEHRVFFVCISRAKRICYLLRSKKITVYSKRYGRTYIINKEPSMFWDILYNKYGGDGI